MANGDFTTVIYITQLSFSSDSPWEMVALRYDVKRAYGRQRPMLSVASSEQYST